MKSFVTIRQRIAKISTFLNIKLVSSFQSVVYYVVVLLEHWFIFWCIRLSVLYDLLPFSFFFLFSLLAFTPLVLFCFTLYTQNQVISMRSLGGIIRCSCYNLETFLGLLLIILIFCLLNGLNLLKTSVKSHIHFNKIMSFCLWVVSA